MRFIRELLFMWLVFLLASLIGAAGIFLSVTGWLSAVIVCLISTGWYILRFRKGKAGEDTRRAAGVSAGIFAAFMLAALALSGGNYQSQYMYAALGACVPFFPLYLLMSLTGLLEVQAAVVFGVPALIYLILTVLGKKRVLPRAAGILAVCAALGLFWINRPQARYGGHGFAYMNGWSSTDFTGYHVYDGEKLAVLDHEPEFMIENESDMPVLDGAEACYPVYAAMAKTLYRDIADIELRWQKEMKQSGRRPWQNGKIVSFTNTVSGYSRLIMQDVDLMFAARPSERQKEEAAKMGEEIVCEPIGKEAFVFFTTPDNPVDSLTIDEIRGIWSGRITNWKELGGKDQKILAFQRPEESGSQVTMRAVMKDVPMKEPLSYEIVDPMMGVIRETAQYHSEAGAVGYSFRYFLEELNQEGNVKVLAVNGIRPTPETIRDGSYPITVDLVCAYLKSNQKPYVRRVLDFLLSEDGQMIIEKTGYGRLGN